MSKRNDFFERSIKFISEMKKYEEIDLDDMFFGNPPRIDQFHKALDKIIIYIEDVKKIPLEKRNHD
jgi:hypothetical protein